MGLPFSIDALDQIAAEICRVGERLWRQGFCAGADGNISARLDEDAVVITPSGVSKGHMRSDAMCVLRLADGALIHGRRPSSERAVHLAAYRARSDVEAVIHAHSPKAVAWSCTGKPLPEAVHPEVELVLGPVPLVSYVTPGTEALGGAVAAALTPMTAACLMGNHGPVAFGQSLEQALHRLETLEAYCRLLADLGLFGGMRRLSDAEMAALLTVKRDLWGFPDERC